MYDAGKIGTGLVAFLGLALLPVWQSAGGTAKRPEPKIVTTETRCVLPKAQMRPSHMALLNEWRDASVRRGERTARTADGRTLDLSFSGSCMRCHPNRADFCDSCHNDFAVKPYCWDCHLEPVVAKEKA